MAVMCHKALFPWPGRGKELSCCGLCCAVTPEGQGHPQGLGGAPEVLHRNFMSFNNCRSTLWSSLRKCSLNPSLLTQLLPWAVLGMVHSSCKCGVSSEAESRGETEMHCTKHLHKTLSHCWETLLLQGKLETY